MLSPLLGWALLFGGLQAPVHPLPFLPASPDPAVAGTRWTPVPAAIHELAALDAVTLAAVPLDATTFVDLDLERIKIERMRFAFRVDDQDRPDLLDGLDLSLWRGTVRGEPDSEVRLSFSQHGSRGWIRRGATLLHVLPRPSVDGNWALGDVLLATEEAVQALGVSNPFECEATAPPTSNPPPGSGARRSAQMESQSGAQALTCAMRECAISITSDFQFYQRFNSIPAQTAYVTTLFGFVSDRYETQASTVLTFPYVQFYSTAADPWIAQDTAPPNDCVDVLNELQAAWNGAIPNGGRIGHLLSGASLGCGVAWLGVLCEPEFAFSVSGNLNGTISFPIVQQPNNWDFIVTSHEIGHNFDALHTHDYCPPLDQCAPSGYFGQCQTAQVCAQGTIMSYCHLCAGGTANIIPSFHAVSAQDMTAHAAACLPCYFGVDVSRPLALAPDVPTPVSATVTGPAPTSVELLWSANGGGFTAVAMTNGGGSVWNGSLPGFPCGTDVRFAYRFQHPTFGTVHEPVGGTAAPFLAEAVNVTPVFTDNFQTNLGWTATVAGATAGQWQRGVPVNDPGWAYDPAADADGSGSCYLTQNAVGNTDVDNGSVTLTSPALDLSGAGATIEYYHYLFLTVTDGVDRLLVEASANGTAGPWVAIATHTASTAGAWTAVTLGPTELQNAGFVGTSNSRVRFTANDGGTQSIVEAGVDGFRVSRRTCSITSFCAGDGSTIPCPCGNNGGLGRGCASSVWASGALLGAAGNPSVGADTIQLTATELTGASCVFFQATATAPAVVVDDGIGCVGGSIVRLGTSTVALNASTYPQVGDPSVSVRGVIPPAGGQRYYQAFYRNAVAAFCPPATSNRTNGVGILWVP